jgi:hypothetical protein
LRLRIAPLVIATVWRKEFCISTRRMVVCGVTIGTLIAAGHISTSVTTALSIPGGVTATNPIVYMDDAPHVGHPCSGDSSILHYKVFYPTQLATYPVVFLFQGAGSHSVSDCDPDTHRDKWLSMDTEAATRAANGFVAVNVEYHGLDATPPLFGDSTCPTLDCRRSTWGSAADGYVQRNLKRAVDVFFDPQRDPLTRYGADERRGLIAFGGSAGGHGAYMLTITSISSLHPFDAAIGWSGMGDIAQAGSDATTPYENYMAASLPQPGSDQFDFGSPRVRLTSNGPALYIANAQFEFVDPASALSFYEQCAEPRVPRCWLRVVDSDQHATGYEDYAFRGPTDSNELTVPQARHDVTVFQDSICFVHRVLGMRDTNCP